jgi:hypothetical protein
MELFGPGLPEMLAEAERDLLARRRLYHNRVFTRRLSHDKAERRLEVVEAIVENLRAQLTPGELAEMQLAKDKKLQRKLKRVKVGV